MNSELSFLFIKGKSGASARRGMRQCIQIGEPPNARSLNPLTREYCRHAGRRTNFYSPMCVDLKISPEVLSTRSVYSTEEEERQKIPTGSMANQSGNGPSSEG